MIKVFQNDIKKGCGCTISTLRPGGKVDLLKIRKGGNKRGVVQRSFVLFFRLVPKFL